MNNLNIYHQIGKMYTFFAKIKIGNTLYTLEMYWFWSTCICYVDVHFSVGNRLKFDPIWVLSPYIGTHPGEGVCTCDFNAGLMCIELQNKLNIFRGWWETLLGLFCLIQRCFPIYRSLRVCKERHAVMIQ